MNISVRLTGLCVLSLLFITLLVHVSSLAARAQPEVVKCPCRYDLVPKTAECWPGTESDPPAFREQPETNAVCSLRPGGEGLDASLSVRDDNQNGTTPNTCNIAHGAASCGPRDFFAQNLTSEELKACQCELQAYVTALDEGGISVSGGPPYECGNVDCRTVTTTPIPTLSEWGLIAMAGILGIIGFMVIRRRKVSA